MNSRNSLSDRKRKVLEISTASSCSSSDTNGSQDDLREDSGETRKVSYRDLKFHSGRSIKRRSTRVSKRKVSKSSSSSSSSEKDTKEKCPICLKKLKSQKLAVTNKCSHHTFCLSCLIEWSKAKSTCPVDRTKYESILVLDSSGKVEEEMGIKSWASSFKDAINPSQSSVFCEVCGLFHHQEAMLVCDGCSLGYHLFCLMPPMGSRPSGVWLCNDCWYYYNY